MSIVRQDRAAEYPRQAQQIRTVAVQMSHQDVRKQLLETVCRLEVLALEEERWGERPGPVQILHPTSDVA